MNILPSHGHCIFIGRPSQYQGSIVKFFANKVVHQSSRVEYRDLSGEGIPLNASHERLTIAADILQGEPGALVVTAGHYGVSSKFDLEGFESVARIWECEQHGQTLQVILTELWPATGREIHLQGTQEHSEIVWQEVAAPEPAPVQRQRQSMADGHGDGMPDASGARTMIGEFLKANPGKRIIA